MRNMMAQHEELHSGIQATRLQRRLSEAAAGLGTTVANLLTVRDKTSCTSMAGCNFEGIPAANAAVLWRACSAVGLISTDAKLVCLPCGCTKVHWPAPEKA